MICLRNICAIRRGDSVVDPLIRGKCGAEGLDERINEGMLQWFAHVERMQRDRIAKRVSM